MPRILFIVFLCGLSLKREKQAYRRIYKYNGCKRIHQSERTFIKSIKALAKLDRTTYKVTFRVWLLLYGTSLSRAAAPAAGSWSRARCAARYRLSCRMDAPPGPSTWSARRRFKWKKSSRFLRAGVVAVGMCLACALAIVFGTPTQHGVPNSQDLAGRSLQDFPKDVLLNAEPYDQATNRYWLFLHAIGTIYMFYGLAIGESTNFRAKRMANMRPPSWQSSSYYMHWSLWVC